MYYDGLSVHEAALTSAGNNSTAVNAEYDTWDAWVTQLEKQYPVWAEKSFTTSSSRQTNSQQAIQSLTHFIFQDGARSQGRAIPPWSRKNLHGSYETAAAAYQEAGAKSDYYSAQSKVSDGWIAYVDQIAVLFVPPTQADHPVGVQGSNLKVQT